MNHVEAIRRLKHSHRLIEFIIFGDMFLASLASLKLLQLFLLPHELLVASHLCAHIEIILMLTWNFRFFHAHFSLYDWRLLHWLGLHWRLLFHWGLLLMARRLLVMRWLLLLLLLLLHLRLIHSQLGLDWLEVVLVPWMHWLLIHRLLLLSSRLDHFHWLSDHIGLYLWRRLLWAWSLIIQCEDISLLDLRTWAPGKFGCFFVHIFLEEAEDAGDVRQFLHGLCS